MARMKNDKTKTDRLNRIKQILSNSSEESAFSITDIYNEVKGDYKVDRKTIERDIEYLTINYPLQDTGSNPRKYFFEAGFSIDYELCFN